MAEVLEVTTCDMSVISPSWEAIGSTSENPQPVTHKRHEQERRQCQQKDKTIERAGRQGARRGVRLGEYIVHLFR